MIGTIRALLAVERDNRVVRVVSLVPSVTETLLAWGVVPVACTRFCDAPGVAKVGGTKDPAVAAIVGLAPDLVVMDEEENRRPDHDMLVAAGVPVHVLAVRSVDDVAQQLARLAERLAVPWEPPRLPRRSPRVHRHAVVPIWRRPWMVLGHPTYGASLLGRLGIDVVAPTGGGAYPAASLDELVGIARRHRAMVLAPSEPYPFGPRHAAELASVGPVVFVDGRDLFWWGARTEAAARRLAALVDGHDASQGGSPCRPPAGDRRPGQAAAVGGHADRT